MTGSTKGFDVRKALAIALVGFFLGQMAFGLRTTIAQKFYVQELNVEATQMGLLEAVRETPGLLTVFLSVVLIIFLEPTAASLCLFTSAIGLVLYFYAHNLSVLLIAVFIESLGFHFMMPIQSSIILSLSQEGKQAQMLGLIGSIGALGGLLASALIYLTVNSIGLRNIFLVGAIVNLLGGMILLALPREVGSRRSKILLDIPFKDRLKAIFSLKRRYSLFYVLSFFSGYYKHIQATFAIFLMVKILGVSAQTLAVIFGATSIIAIFSRVSIGRIVDMIGEKKAFMLQYTGLIIIFLGYSLKPSTPLIYILYIINGLLGGFGVAMTTYIAKIAPREDITSNLSMRTTIDHAASFLALIIGGWAWDKFGYQVVFIGGAILALMGLLTSFRIETKIRLKERQEALRIEV